MELPVGQVVTFAGVIRTRSDVGDKQPFVKATVELDDGTSIPVVWWDPGSAPALDTQLRVSGRVKEFRGALEVHANDWEADWCGPPDDPIAQIVGFYIGCVEAEAAGSTRVGLGSKMAITLTDGISPTHGPRPLPTNQKTDRWCSHRETALGESIISGWPLVIGGDADRGTAELLASPLLMSGVRLLRSEGQWSIDLDGGGVDLNPYALDLLGIDRAERDALVRLIEETPAVQEARLVDDRAAAILSLLSEAGIPGCDHLDPANLQPHDDREGVRNSGILLATTHSTHITRMLLGDLKELLNKPNLLSTGPAAVMLGHIPAPASSLPKPFPSVVPSTLSQDQAVTSAMENNFTVVTGPPGTGKSQVLVNVIAAAVANRETVLFASKNNQAVDVVFERLSRISPNACIVRSGASSRRSEVATSIANIIDAPRRSLDAAKANRDWIELEERITEIHSVLHQRTRLEGEINQLENELREQLDSLPSQANVDSDLTLLRPALGSTQTALDAFGKSLGLFRRWKKHQQRLDHARDNLAKLAELTGLDSNSDRQILRSVDKKPKRSFIPRSEFGEIEQIAKTMISAGQIRASVGEMKSELKGLPPKHILDDRLHSIGSERVAVSRALLDARWEQARQDDSASRNAAGELGEHLDKAAKGSSGAKEALSLVQKSLKVVPVWGITNLSARTNLPLTPDLFDLVVIDEASQCDIASALPLLARARRALVIGDRRQLIHITNLSESRERIIAQKWGLSDARASEFSYTNRSCFGLASKRINESPIFLNLHFRSHPAIIGFSNEHFYESRLEFCSDRQVPLGEAAIEWKRVQGDCRAGPNGKSRVNPEEARALATALINDVDDVRGLGLSVGVVTPYRAQADQILDHLRSMLEDEVLHDLTVSTTHRFQGDERDVIYFSPVVGPSMSKWQANFAADDNLVNVALTRARRRLVIVGNMDACLKHQNVLTDLANYVCRLEAGAFDSPLEQMLHEALLERGVAAETGVVVAGHRLDLAIVESSPPVDIECDGAAFHTDRNLDSARDRAIEAEGWKVIRFSGRRLCNDLGGCVEEVLAAMP